jgi:phage shock protein B
MVIAFAVFLTLVVGVVTVIRTFVNRNEVQRLSEEEQLQFRRMLESLARMEERVTNLETILNQREGERPAPGGGDPRPAEQAWPFKS